MWDIVKADGLVESTADGKVLDLVALMAALWAVQLGDRGVVVKVGRSAAQTGYMTASHKVVETVFELAVAMDNAKDSHLVELMDPAKGGSVAADSVVS